MRRRCGDGARVFLLRQILTAFFVAGLVAAVADAREFDFRRDTFAFSNDTVLKYGVDEQGALHINKRDKPVEFGHRCFVLARAVLQFHQFARFEPKQPRVSRDDYHQIIRRICRIPVWSESAKKVVVPGYANLHDFSVAYEGLLKEDLGNWLPTYFRVGNWRMMTGHPRGGQAAGARWLAESVEQKKPRAIYMSRFPWMNHAVVIYAVQRRANGDLHFTVYDPNYPDAPSSVDYVASERSFTFPKRWYFPGGRVNVMRIFISPFH